MKKIVRLTERDLTRLVKRVIRENEEEWVNFEKYDEWDKQIEGFINAEVKVDDDKGWPEDWGGPKGGINKGDKGIIIGIDTCKRSFDVMVEFEKGEYCYDYRNLKIKSTDKDEIIKKHKETNISNQQVFEKGLADFLARISNKFKNSKKIENELFGKLNKTIDNYYNEIKEKIGFF